MAMTTPFRFPGITGVRCAFQTRTGSTPPAPVPRADGQPGTGDFDHGNISFDVGDDPARVLAARHALRDELGFDRWVELKQVHGPAMHYDLAGDITQPGTIEGDGLGTELRGHGLVIKTADCQPILVAHSSGKYVAALHAGWRGNRIGFPVTGVRDFCDRYGIRPRDCMAVRGPSLGPGAAEFVDFDGIWDTGFLPYYNHAARTMNLWACARDQLAASGIPRESIFGLDLCTHQNSDTFFSYRRAPVCGRQASLIWIE